MDYYGHLYHSTVLSCENAHRDACAQQGEPRRREKCRKYEKSSRKARVRPAREARAAAGARAEVVALAAFRGRAQVGAAAGLLRLAAVAPISVLPAEHEREIFGAARARCRGCGGFNGGVFARRASQ